MQHRRPAGVRVEFLYEDRDIIAVEKPEGLPVIAPEGSRTKTLYDLVTARIQRKNPRGRAAVVHRLDRDTSGVMIFAVHAGAKKALMDRWNELVLERCYVAVAEGRFARDHAGSDPIGRLCLHAALLGLEHPFTGERFSFESPPPDSFLRLAGVRA